MYALVFWIDSGEISIINKDLLKRFGRGFKASWNKSWYNVAESNDEEFLKRIQVDKDGFIIQKEIPTVAQPRFSDNDPLLIMDVAHAADVASGSSAAGGLDVSSIGDAVVHLETDSTSAPDGSKVELIVGGGIFVPTMALAEIKMKYSGNSKEMCRKLMKLIIGNDKLLRMTPTGAGGMDRIPIEVVEAVFRYVNQTVIDSERLTWQIYRRTLTLMCNTLRNPKKK